MKGSCAQKCNGACFDERCPNACFTLLSHESLRRGVSCSSAAPASHPQGTTCHAKARMPTANAPSPPPPFPSTPPGAAGGRHRAAGHDRAAPGRPPRQEGAHRGAHPGVGLAAGGRQRRRGRGGRTRQQWEGRRQRSHSSWQRTTTTRAAMRQRQRPSRSARAMHTPAKQLCQQWMMTAGGEDVCGHRLC
jgi:hypothetical protein